VWGVGHDFSLIIGIPFVSISSLRPMMDLCCSCTPGRVPRALIFQADGLICFQNPGNVAAMPNMSACSALECVGDEFRLRNFVLLILYCDDDANGVHYFIQKMSHPWRGFESMYNQQNHKK